MAQDMTGERFGRLVVVERAGATASREITWWCRCDCGASTKVAGSSLRRGHTRSCGCLANRGLTPEERFWAKVDRRDECWEWKGARTSTGYGQMRVAGRMVRAHRYAYELLRGPIPDGLELDHLCRCRACVNPSHLEPVDRRTNVLRGIAPSAVNAEKTHCLRGHPFDEANTQIGPDGGRNCRACRRMRAKGLLGLRTLKERNNDHD